MTTSIRSWVSRKHTINAAGCVLVTFSNCLHNNILNLGKTKSFKVDTPMDLLLTPIVLLKLVARQTERRADRPTKTSEDRETDTEKQRENHRIVKATIYAPNTLLPRRRSTISHCQLRTIRFAIPIYKEENMYLAKEMSCEKSATKQSLTTRETRVFARYIKHRNTECTQCLLVLVCHRPPPSTV